MKTCFCKVVFISLENTDTKLYNIGCVMKMLKKIKKQLRVRPLILYVDKK